MCVQWFPPPVSVTGLSQAANDTRKEIGAPGRKPLLLWEEKFVYVQWLCNSLIDAVHCNIIDC